MVYVKVHTCVQHVVFSRRRFGFRKAFVRALGYGPRAFTRRRRKSLIWRIETTSERHFCKTNDFRFGRDARAYLRFTRVNHSYRASSTVRGERHGGRTRCEQDLTFFYFNRYVTDNKYTATNCGLTTNIILSKQNIGYTDSKLENKINHFAHELSHSRADRYDSHDMYTRHYTNDDTLKSPGSRTRGY